MYRFSLPEKKKKKEKRYLQGGISALQLLDVIHL